MACCHEGKKSRVFALFMVCHGRAVGALRNDSFMALRCFLIGCRLDRVQLRTVPIVSRVSFNGGLRFR